MPDDNRLTNKWLESHGFKRDEFYGYSRELSPPQGEGASSLLLTVGNYPANEPCCCLVVGGFGVVTNAGSNADIESLIRLFEDAFIDHPDEVWADLDDECDDDEGRP
jgi:hypothetical protein